MKLPAIKIPFLTRTKAEAFGLELSDSAIKLVQFHRQGENLIADIFVSQPLVAGLVVDGEIKNVTELTNILLGFKKQFGSLLAEQVIASLPDNKTFIQTLTIRKRDEVPFNTRLIEVLPEFLPLDLSEVYFDGIITNETEIDWTAIVAVAPKQQVDVYLQTLDAAGFLPLALDLEPAAISNACISDNPALAKPRAIIELGATRANLIVHDLGAPQFTMRLATSGKKLTDTIAAELKLSPEEAETAKITCGLNSEKCDGVLRKILMSQVDEIVRQVSAANEYYHTHFAAGRPIEELILSGGSAQLQDLDTILSDILKIPVTNADPFTLHNISLPSNTTTKLHMTAGIGLALRGIK